MKSFAFALASAAAISVAYAQYAIDPQSVSNVTRDGWCDQQKTQCPAICLQVTDGSSSATEHNDCYPDSLTYSCVCSNGFSPNISEYSQTLPYFICTEWGTQCVANCGSNNYCANDCRANHPCGAQDPRRYNLTTTSSSGTATKTGHATATNDGDSGATTDANGNVAYSGFGSGSTSQETGSSASSTSASDAANDNGAAALRDFGSAWGLITVFGGLFAGFAILL
ncbi:hypothetical protein K431DRAFT_307551 [Polychaeton citri CBS 116435]|uniref:DUF7707 domain-containing protein n=1 Tax=Polychaeton citri CBS 116435 TaxID=1314669 RepID=A0A9P4PZ36_9PEZI|nr:hypothetical protein K431DRAFT_307551 [Polychaeton citri CBS 116435]